DPAVGAVSGSYGIMNPESCLARLIHEEIIERHRAMPRRVNFLATFNVIYRWDLLERVGGFNERYLKAQDAELSFRVMAEGAELRFVFESRVKHYHATRLLHYLRTQQQQGYWRVWLHLDHRGHAAGDAYSSLVDHLQPPLAMLAVAFAAFLVPTVLATRIAWPRAVLWIPVALVAALAALQLPMTLRLWRRLRELRYLLFAPLGFARAFWRGVGMIHGLAGYLRARVGDRPRPQASTSHHA
ncbi:MAG: glycosyltransferase, partial [Phycisphaerae bacterium]